MGEDGSETHPEAAGSRDDARQGVAEDRPKDAPNDEEGSGGHGTRVPCRARAPLEPTTQMKEDHCLAGHVDFRRWCDACV